VDDHVVSTADIRRVIRYNRRLFAYPRVHRSKWGGCQKNRFPLARPSTTAFIVAFRLLNDMAAIVLTRSAPAVRLDYDTEYEFGLDRIDALDTIRTEADDGKASTPPRADDPDRHVVRPDAAAVGHLCRSP
jgi:hypothetical protein